MAKKLLNAHGRPKSSSVWNYFEDHAESDSSMCMVLKETEGGEVKLCGDILRGRNTTNLKKHLKSFHVHQFAEMMANDDSVKLMSSDSKGAGGSSPLHEITPTIMKLGRPASSPKFAKNASGETRWSMTSHKHRHHVRKLTRALVSTGCSTLIVENAEFGDFIRGLQPKFDLPGHWAFDQDVGAMMIETTGLVRTGLSQMRRFSLCLNLCTLKGMSSGFLCISACGYNEVENCLQHLTLSFHHIVHLLTGEIGALLAETMTKWNINPSQILLVITDNGSHMARPSKPRLPCVKMESDNMEEEEEEEEEIVETDDVEFDDSGIFLPRMACFAHSLQLIVNSLTRSGTMQPVLCSARNLVDRIKSCSQAQQRLKSKTNKVVRMDNKSRWSNTYLMVQRLIELKTAVIEVTREFSLENLPSSEWKMLEQMEYLLKPFADHTRLFVSGDAVTLSSVIPAILDLEYHLLKFQGDQTVDYQLKVVAADLVPLLRQKFETLLVPGTSGFLPMPAAATLLDPGTSAVLTTSNRSALLQAAKEYILSLHAERDEHMDIFNVGSVPTSSEELSTPTSSSSTPQPSSSSALKRFSFLSEAMNIAPPTANKPTVDISAELAVYCYNIPYECDSAMSWWLDRLVSYPTLSPIAMDIISAPASENYMERILCLPGDWSMSMKSRSDTNLENRVFLRLNRELWARNASMA